LQSSPFSRIMSRTRWRNDRTRSTSQLFAFWRQVLLYVTSFSGKTKTPHTTQNLTLAKEAIYGNSRRPPALNCHVPEKERGKMCGLERAPRDHSKTVLFEHRRTILTPLPYNRRHPMHGAVMVRCIISSSLSSSGRAWPRGIARLLRDIVLVQVGTAMVRW
jgi:hypothetical protein